MKFLTITTKKDFDKAVRYFSDKKVIGLDVETTDFEPWVGDLSLIQISDGENTVVVDVFALFEEAGIDRSEVEKGRALFTELKTLLENPEVKVVIHNAKFEHKWLVDKCGIFCNSVFDTFLAAQLVDFNSDNDPKRAHNLAAVMRRYVGEDLDKTEQKSDWSVRPLTQEQLEYAALDVIFLPKLREELIQPLASKELLRVAKIEFDAVGVVAKMELRGVKVNRERYTEEIKVLKQLRTEAERHLQARVKSDKPKVQGSLFGEPEKDFGEVLLTSSSQIKSALNKLDIPVFSKKEIETFEAYRKEEKYIKNASVNERVQIMKERFPKFDHELYTTYKKAVKEGRTIIEGTGAKALLRINQNEYEVIGNLKEFRATEKLVSSYGDNFLQYLVDHGNGNERVHSNFRQIGAATGRFSCNNPNIQQIPAGNVSVAGKKHRVAFREAFDFPEGYKGINADYSQIELRIAAELAGDRNMTDTFKSGRDLHADTASKVFNVPYEQCAEDGHEYYNTYRKYSKSINFGIVYGMGAGALANQIHVTEEEAQEMINKYSETYPQLWRYLKNQFRLAGKRLYAVTASGRRQEFKEPSKDQLGEPVKAELAAIGRNGMNMPIQGTSADILKRALKILHDKMLPYDAHIVNIVHDEITVEARDDENLETVRKMVEDSMIEAAEEFIKDVPILVDAKIVDNWASK